MRKKKFNKDYKVNRASQIEYDLQSNDMYTFIQISHLLATIPDLSTKIPWRIFLYVTNPTTSIKGISLFYNFLNQKSTFTKTPTMRTWEIEFKSSYTIAQCQIAISSTYKATKSANLWELYQKLLLRWYLTPARMAGFSSQSSPLCWRQCGNRGSIIHIFWTCPLERNFWSTIFATIEHITGAQLPETPGSAILFLEINNIPSQLTYIISLMFLSARLEIVKRWKKIEVPTLVEVMRTTNLHIIYEVMFATSQGNYQSQYPRWKPWFDWYNPNRVR